jgi:hypothetical protein
MDFLRTQEEMLEESIFRHSIIGHNIKNRKGAEEAAEGQAEVETQMPRVFQLSRQATCLARKQRTSANERSTAPSLCLHDHSAVSSVLLRQSRSLSIDQPPDKATTALCYLLHPQAMEVDPAPHHQDRPKR